MGERMLSLIVILGVAVAGTFGLSMLSILVGVLALSAHGLKREADLYRSARALRLDEVLVVGIGANLHSNAIACGSAFLSGLSVIQIGALIDGFVRDHGGAVALWDCASCPCWSDSSTWFSSAKCSTATWTREWMV